MMISIIKMLIIKVLIKISNDALSSQSPVNEVELDAEGESSVIRRDLQLPNVEVSNLINSNAPMHQLQHVL